MPNSIEIFENTLLKFVTRQGLDSDRLNITFASGELAYTTDTSKLYIGDGSTPGGILVGNSFSGSASDITTLTPASIGDLAYDSANNKLYRLIENDGSNISDWQEIGGVYTAGDTSISISSDNKISVGLLSASNFDQSGFETPIYLNGSGQVSLSSTVLANGIIPRSTTHITLHPSLNINGLPYQFPSTYSTGAFLKVSNAGGTLVWDEITLNSLYNKTLTVNFPLTASSDGVDVTGAATNPLSGDLVIGVSPTLSCYNIWARYNADTNTIISNKGISTVTRQDVGDYVFEYDNALPISHPFASVQIIGVTGPDIASSYFYNARVAEINETSCRVLVYSNGGSYGYPADIDIALKIES